MRSTAPILEVENAQVGPDSELGITTPMSLRLMPGECALIEAAAAHQLSAFANLCIGLGALRSGQIRFVGRDWSGLPHEYAGALRSRIGRVFTVGGWLPFLSVENNILLPALYHTHRSQDELHREALVLAQELGLPGLPVGYPEEFDAADLRRAALVRALLGEPLLLLLEEPIEDPLEPLGRAVLNRTAMTRNRGGAVAWLTRSRSFSTDPSFPASQRLRLGDHGLTRPRPAA